MTSGEHPMATREWSDLPELALATIAWLLLPTYRDLFAFASVCRSWRSLLRSLSPSLLPSLPPLRLRLGTPLLIPTTSALPFRLLPDLLPPAASYRFLSFSHGHLLLLLTSSPQPLQPFLADVITGSRIFLPPLPSDKVRFPYYYATLTAPPSSPSSLVLLFFSKFSFLSCQVSSPGATWTRHRFSPEISFITHVISFRNRLFGLNDHARLLELDLSPDQGHAVRFSPVRGPYHAPHDFDRWNFGPQLVCTPDQLFLVLFILNHVTDNASLQPERRRFTKIEVYSMDWRRMEWVEVESLPEHAIFVDCAGKAPVLCEKPEAWGGKSNCIYVAGPGYPLCRRVSIGEQPVFTVPPLPYSSLSGPRWPSSIWIHPSPFY